MKTAVLVINWCITLSINSSQHCCLFIDIVELQTITLD